jgi:hypothetical protein
MRGKNGVNGLFDFLHDLFRFAGFMIYPTTYVCNILLYTDGETDFPHLREDGRAFGLGLGIVFVL